MHIAGLILQFACGILGGWAIARLSPRLARRDFGDAIAGLVGGGVGVHVAMALSGLNPVQSAQALSDLTLGPIATQVAGGLIGGAGMAVFVRWLEHLSTCLSALRRNNRPHQRHHAKP